MKFLFSPSPLWQDKGVAIVRIIVGLLLIYHGAEVFQPEIMKGYMDWETFNSSMGKFMVYMGKTSELIAGILFLLGLFTRVASLIAIGTFLYITFFIGNGRFWYEDHHPFLFVMLAILLFFTGPGAWSVDGAIRRK